MRVVRCVLGRWTTGRSCCSFRRPMARLVSRRWPLAPTESASCQGHRMAPAWFGICCQAQLCSWCSKTTPRKSQGCFHCAIASVGWDGMLRTWRDDTPLNIAECPIHMHQDREWTADAHHNDDILCLDFVPESFLVTGSFDGEILVSNCRSGLLLGTLCPKTAVPGFCQKTGLEGQLLLDKSHPAVEKVLWLAHRQQSRRHRMQSATLVTSSDSGLLLFWNASKSALLGMINLRSSEAVPAISSDADNEMLIVGDKTGTIRLFDISQYCLSLEPTVEIPPLTASWEAHSQPVSALAFSNESTCVISASADGCVKLWSTGGDLLGLLGQSTPSGWRLQRHDKANAGADRQCDSPASQNSTDPQLPLRQAEHEEEEDSKETKCTLPSKLPPIAGAAAQPDSGLARDREQPVLGRQFMASTEAKTLGRRQHRSVLAKPDLRKATPGGFNKLCHPYQAIRFSELDLVNPPREPSAVARKQRSSRRSTPKLPPISPAGRSYAQVTASSRQ
eukprot:m.314238 g.314238  ORF g.314238 m.314238 type:complete len:505 (-) comp19667_c0_seq2:110-1624(-)